MTITEDELKKLENRWFQMGREYQAMLSRLAISNKKVKRLVRKWRKIKGRK